MDLNKFLESLDIFQQEDEPYAGVKSAGMTIGAILLLTFPAATLRWDGSVRNFWEDAPAKVQLEQMTPNAFMNRAIRFVSVIAGGWLAINATVLDFKEYQRAPLRRKKREAQEILQDEIINAEIIKHLPQEPEDEKPELPSAMQQIMNIIGKGNKETAPADSEEDLEALANKFTRGKQSQATDAANADDAMSQAIKMSAIAEGDRFAQFRIVGEAIINSMTVSDKSVMIASGTGTGKTTTEREYLKRLKAKYPNVQIWALLNKADDLPGVERNRRVLFNPELLSRIYEEDSGVTLRHALPLLFQLFDIFTERRQLPEAERKRLKEQEPIRLILGDWFYTFQELQARLSKKDFQLVLSMIRGIITIGRDQGVGLIVDTQSANLSALGLADDQSIRQSLDIYSQGYIYYEDGEVKGELETIRLVFNLNGVCSPENRKLIKQAYDILASAIERNELKTPIIFTSVGARPRLGIVPPLESPTEFVGAIPLASIDEELAAMDNEPTYTRFELSFEQAQRQVMTLKDEEGWNQTQIIKHLWGASPGGTDSYKKAKTEYEALTNELQNV